MDDIRENLKEMSGDIKEIRKDMNHIKGDLRYHIKRTDQVEKELLPVSKFVSSLKILGFLLGLYFAITKFIMPAKAATPIKQSLFKIQREVGCQIKVHSHKRTKSHNKRVGGAKNSYHLTGDAMDISAFPCAGFYTLAKTAYKYTSVIVYPTHVHIDNRKNKVCLIKRGRWYTPCKFRQNGTIY